MARWAWRVAAGVAAATGLAQAWVTFDWIGNQSDHCDFPEECFTSWLPRAFALLEYLWIATVVAGIVALVLAAMLGVRRRDIAALGIAVAASFLAYALSPMVQTTPGTSIVDFRIVEENSFFWGGPGYTVAAVIMAGASLVFAWQAVLQRSSELTPRPLNA